LVVNVRLELKDIKGDGLEQAYTCTLSDFKDLVGLAEEGGPVFYEPLTFELRFQRTGQFVEVDGHFDATVGLKCGRCLQNFKQPLSETFTLTFVPRSDAVETEEEIELDVEELGLIPYSDETLELLDPLQEQLLMAIPISPLCDESCRGLCPECGGNRNIKACDCTRQPFNNKFTALAGMDFKK
jgi:uncharacterized protein